MKDRMKKTMSVEPRISSVLHLRAGMRGVPLAGNFELTARCNFNCRMCYVHQNQDPEKELTAQQWIELGRHARDRGMLFLLITGGEPMLRPDFPLIYKSLREMGLMVSINTNASLLTDEILELFRNFPPTRLNISLYGGNHETYRNLCGTAAYDIVTRNILRLKELGLSVKINCSVTPYNAGDIEQIYGFAKENGLQIQGTTYMYPPVRINGCKYGEAPARFTWEEAAAYMLKCREQLLTPEQLANSTDGRFELEEDCANDTGEPMWCRAGRTAFWVTWDGRMLPCGMFPQEGYSVREMGFDRAWEQVRAYVRQIRMPRECADCPKKGRCNSCAAACIAESGSTEIKPDYICKMTQRLENLTWEKYGERANEDQ